MKTLIQKLVETNAPSGSEGPVRDVIRGELDGLVDEIRVDALGNLIARKGTRQDGGLRIMLAAHMDEIGVIATHVDEKGFVRFTGLGGVYPRYCSGGRVRFLSGARGVINSEPPDGDRVPGLDKMYIDVGARDAATCPVQIGDVGVFERPFAEVGDRLSAKALDDRVGAAVLIEALRRVKGSPHEIIAVFSTQEEVGTRGAATAAFGVDPEVGIALDVTATGDTPKARKMAVSLGAGPAIKVKDSGMISDPRVVSWMVGAAESARIPYQLEILEGGSTDARAMQINRAGVPAGCISIPCRYVHSPSEMVDLADVENSVRLLVELISKPVSLG